MSRSIKVEDVPELAVKTPTIIERIGELEIDSEKIVPEPIQ